MKVAIEINEEGLAMINLILMMNFKKQANEVKKILEERKNDTIDLDLSFMPETERTQLMAGLGFIAIGKLAEEAGIKTV